MSNWSKEKSLKYYLINKWGKPYFDINDKGNLICMPEGNDIKIDIKKIIDKFIEGGGELPVLLRFNNIINHRVISINEKFNESIKRYKYNGYYKSIMPIKVNHQKNVLELFVKYGQKYSIGLEAGTKPELIETMLFKQKKQFFLICNGYKDREYISIVLNMQKLGRVKPFLVIDRVSELFKIISMYKNVEFFPNIGIRVKLSNKIKDKWENFSRSTSKFGLSSNEIMLVIDILKKNNMLNCLKLLHFHIGSQVNCIYKIKKSLQEVSYIYCNLKKIDCNNLEYIDIGGGLAIDYNGSKSLFGLSMNYTLDEYVDNVILTISNICNKNNVFHPNIISESGRAFMGQHAALIFNVMENNSIEKSIDVKKTMLIKDKNNIIRSVMDIYLNLNYKNYIKSHKYAFLARKDCNLLFNHGLIDLFTKTEVENIYWLILIKIKYIIKKYENLNDDLLYISKQLSDIYYCNFSIFRSISDFWAIDHIFPIIPIHRLNEEPKNDAIIMDLTCDSDGKIDKFINKKGVSNSLKLHHLNNESYYLGIFLIGAYQETLSNLHNLFGSTNVIHLDISSKNKYYIKEVILGNKIDEVLELVKCKKNKILISISSIIKKAIKSKEITSKEALLIFKKLTKSLSSYTYLKD
jgi:arginine decarboxylase